MVLTSEAAKVFETPNASMRTLAAPSRGAQELSLWRVEMRAGQAGPQHAVDREQVWVLLEGRAAAIVDGCAETADAGDVLVLPAHVTRQVSAPDGLVALVASGAAPAVTTAEGERPLPWAA